jgi:hypothetical protein
LIKVGLNNVILGLTIDSNDNVYAGSNPIYLSTNGGDDWSVIPTPSDVNCIFTNDNMILYGYWGGIYKTLDMGENWTQVLQLVDVTNSIVENIDGTLFAGITSFFGGGGVYRSFDSGDTWEYCGLLDNYIWSLAVNSQGVLFAGSVGEDIGLFRSYNNGNTWEYIVWDITVDAIAITPDDVIYIGCSSCGVARSFDSGNTWEFINSGLGDNPHAEGTEVTVTSTHSEGYEFVNWTEEGIVVSELPVYIFAVERTLTLVANFKLINGAALDNINQYKYFPNPFSTVVTFEYPLLSSEGLLRICSAMGNVVFTGRLNGAKTSFDLSHLPQGVYIYSIETDGHYLHKGVIVKE